MAIRDRFRRALHKSDSESNISQSDTNMTMTTTATTITTNTSSETSSQAPSLHRQPTQQPKFAFPWGRSDKEKEDRKEEKEKKKQQKKKASGKPMHPRDKPLTATNLRHQEMLGGFDFSFGSSPNRLSQLVPAGPMDHIGVSPCCTRPGSINGDAMSPDEDDSDQEPGTSHAEGPKVAVVPA